MRFYGSGCGDPLDKILMESFFQGVHGGFFIEAGAFDGWSNGVVCRSFEEYLGWTGINIEPYPRTFAKLAVNRPGSVNLNMALSNVNGRLQFRQPNHSTYGLDNSLGSIKNVPEGDHEVVEVETVTFERLVRSRGVAKVDLMILDVEGYEPEVVQGMAGSPVLPRIICAEHSHCGFAPLSDGLRGLGYEHVMSVEQDSVFRRG